MKNQIDLKERWTRFRNENPKTRIRDAAKQLGVSEAELLVTGCGETVIKLTDNFPELLQEFHTLGRIMALTRNDEIVHERKGEYKNVEVTDGHGKMGLVLGDDIDLRIFFDKWHFGFAVTSESLLALQRSFQFFGIDGAAVHKVFLTDESDLAAYEKLVKKYLDSDQKTIVNIDSNSKKQIEKPDAEIDVEGFRKAWATMKDTHDFFGVTKKFKVSREQALRLADKEMAFQVPHDAYQDILYKASETKLPIMVFVGNEGIIQIHSGEVEKIVKARGWFNVLDEKFNLHIKHDEIGSTWIVKKPTDDGIVTSLEIFNRKGENIALFFGKRKPGIPEKEDWRKILSTIKPL
jgi:putative hemin transport protein